MLRVLLDSIDWFGFLAEVVLESMVVCLMRIGKALPTKLLPKKLNRDDIRFVYKDGKLFETIVRIYPLKNLPAPGKPARRSRSPSPLTQGHI
jgi:hypothetical protein